MSTIPPGTLVPDFEALATGDKQVRLSDFKGKNVVLYFYPKDDTPGCTREGQEFRDHYDQLKALDAVVLGVSRDTLHSHENFKCKQEFPFDLLSDPEEKLCRLFDVVKMKNIYGKEVRGIERSTFLIDKEGRLADAWRKVQVNGHVAQVLRKLRELS